MAGSPVMQELAAAGEAPPPTSYTVISTRYDQVVTPYESQALAGATNVVVQDACPLDPSDHVGLQYDPVAIQWVLNALARTGPANPAFMPDCTGTSYGTDPEPQSGQVAPSGSPPAADRPRLVVKRLRVEGRRRVRPRSVRARAVLTALR